MRTVLLCFVASALASPLRLEGFDRVLVHGDTLVLDRLADGQPSRGTCRLELDNRYTARAEVRVGGVLLGELRPHQRAVVHGVGPDSFRVTWTLPGWVERDELAARCDEASP